ncbi:MAG: acyl-CoA thioesterase [Bacteroidales bacterium]|nr:acyl-CoA thioesterase [Bacteroidales bacterium]
MITSENIIQVRYDEVDKMGYVYHGNYAKYYHISRTELLRKVGISDRELESQNIILPVIEMNIRYIQPVYYDNFITIKTKLLELPETRMKFQHEVINQHNELLNIANSTLVFVNSNTRKPMIVPEIILNKLELYIKNKNQ